MGHPKTLTLFLNCPGDTHNGSGAAHMFDYNPSVEVAGRMTIVMLPAILKIVS